MNIQQAHVFIYNKQMSAQTKPHLHTHTQTGMHAHKYTYTHHTCTHTCHSTMCAFSSKGALAQEKPTQGLPAGLSLPIEVREPDCSLCECQACPRGEAKLKFTEQNTSHVEPCFHKCGGEPGRWLGGVHDCTGERV